MNTEILKTDALHPDGAAISRAADIIRAGGLVAFPTETVYGLGADATSADGAKKIYAAKGRPSDNPLIVHIAEPADAELYAYTNELYYALASAFMPGPLTIILPKRPTVPDSVTGGLDSVGLRCPSHPVAHALIAAAGVGIAAPSANLSGSPSPTCAEHVISDMNSRIDAILSGGECEIGLESTIVKVEGDGLTLLRPGAVTADALRLVCPKVEISSAVIEALKENERPLSPGMKYRHYAPACPLVLLDGKSEDVLSFLKSAQESESCVILCYSEEAAELGSKGILDIGGSQDIDTQAKNLFAALRQADKMGGDVIYAHLPPCEGFGLALYNRMIRAAAHTVKNIGPDPK